MELKQFEVQSISGVEGFNKLGNEDSFQQNIQDTKIDEKSEQFEDHNLLIEKDKEQCFSSKKSVIQVCLLVTFFLIGSLYLLIDFKSDQNTRENNQQSDEVYDLVLLNSSSALCLDGSPGAYYISREGNPDNVYIYFQGGAWCGDDNYQKTLQSCYFRSKSGYGSSAFYSSKGSFTQGVFSQQKSNYFKDWKKVFFLYCDGSGHQGSRKQPIPYKDTLLYFRGHNITVERLEDLQQKIGLFSKAKRIVVSGQSAGGLASFTWADYVAKRAKNAKVYCIPGSGIFYDSMNSETHDYEFRKVFINLMNITNKQIDNPVTGCVKQYSNEKYKCMFAQYIYRHIKTPIFVIQSLYDSYSIPTIINARCGDFIIKNCGEEKAKFISQYRKNVSDLLVDIGKDKKNGVWGIDCIGHIYLSLYKFYSEKFEIPEQSGNQMTKTIERWIENTTNDHVFIDSVQWPNNKPCSFDT